MSLIQVQAKPGAEPALGPPPGPAPPGFMWIAVPLGNGQMTWGVHPLPGGAPPADTPATTTAARTTPASPSASSPVAAERARAGMGMVPGPAKQAMNDTKKPPLQMKNGLNVLVRADEATEWLKAGLPVSSSLRVIGLNLDREISHAGMVVRTELNGDALKVVISISTNDANTAAVIYKNFAQRYVKLALLIGNEPLVLIVDCGETRKPYAFRAEKAGVLGCLQCAQTYCVFSQLPRIVVGDWNPMPADITNGNGEDESPAVRFQEPRPDSSGRLRLPWTMRPSNAINACLCTVLSFHPILAPFFWAWCCQCGSFEVDQVDTWSINGNLAKIVVKKASCHDQVALTK